MKTYFLSLLALSAAGAGWAQDVGRVISSMPIIQQVAVPHRVCNTEQISYQQPSSGAGAILGALAGAAIGNSVGGRGAERAAATAIGMVGGAVVRQLEAENCSVALCKILWKTAPAATRSYTNSPANNTACKWPRTPAPRLLCKLPRPTG